jgi:hypothetical protein
VAKIIGASSEIGIIEGSSLGSQNLRPLADSR